MPNINLRLTEAELTELREWAYDNRRSIQKEIIFRLFSTRAKTAPEVDIVTGEPHTAMSGLSVQGEAHFKPDFGSKLK